MKLAENMKEHGGATETLSRSLLSRVLIANQIAVSLALFAGANLFGRSLRNLQNVDLGFQREGIAIFEIDPTSVGYSGHGARAFCDQLLERTRTLAGVRSAALMRMTPISNRVTTPAISTNGFRTPLTMGYNPVSSGYFTTLGIPLLAGRDFRPEDEPVVTPRGWAKRNAYRVCFLDQSLARQQFGTASAVGGRFCLPGTDCSGLDGINVIGVVKGVHYGEITQPDMVGTIYVPSWSAGAETRSLAVRFAR